MGVNIKQNADGSMGLQGSDLDNGAFVLVNIPYTTSTPLTLSGAVCKRQYVVHSVILCPDTASSNAVTATCYAAPSGTALGSGTAVTGTMALNGTAATNVTGAVTAANALVAAGSRVGIVVSGALGAAGSGVCTISLAPA